MKKMANLPLLVPGDLSDGVQTGPSPEWEGLNV